MDLCHPKNSELDKKLEKYIGHAVLRGVVVKDDSWSYAVFTEQGSSASHMTAAKVLHVISKQVMQYHTQVKMEDAPSYWEYQNQSAHPEGPIFTFLVAQQKTSRIDGRALRPTANAGRQREAQENAHLNDRICVAPMFETTA